MSILTSIAGLLYSNAKKVALTEDVIGVDQTWQVVTRAYDTVYTNDTGKPIQVCGAVYPTLAGTSGSRVAIYVDGLSLFEIAGYSIINIRFPFSFIVPNGSTYELRPAVATSSTIFTWRELR